MSTNLIILDLSYEKSNIKKQSTANEKSSNWRLF